ncbi:MAG: hypothetical protein ACI3XI_00415 [Eubacteriales bacterium]
MKISYKMKKLFVTILATTLSIIMFMTSASAINIVTISEEFTDDEEVVYALEYFAWDKDRHWLTVAVDLCFNEEDTLNEVDASLELWISNTSSSPTTPYYHKFIFGSYNCSNTCDSDELLLFITDFNPNFERHFINAQIAYTVYYDDGNIQEYLYEYFVMITTDGNWGYSRVCAQ